MSGNGRRFKGRKGGRGGGGRGGVSMPVSNGICRIKPRVCQKYIKKECPRDETTCRYYHGVFPCKYYYCGMKCKYSNNCMFHHGGPLDDHFKTVLVNHVTNDPPDCLGTFNQYKHSPAQLWQMINDFEEKMIGGDSANYCADEDWGWGNDDVIEIPQTDGASSYEMCDGNSPEFHGNWNIEENSTGDSNEFQGGRPNVRDRRGGSKESHGKSKGNTQKGKKQTQVKPKTELCRNWLKGSGKGPKCHRTESECWHYHGSFPCKFYHLGKQCRYGDNCRFTHGGPLTDHLKEVLIHHIVNDPDDVVGGFPRYTRERVMEKISAHEKTMLKCGRGDDASADATGSVGVQNNTEMGHSSSAVQSEKNHISVPQKMRVDQSSNDLKNSKNPFDVRNGDPDPETVWAAFVSAPVTDNPWDVGHKHNEQTQPTHVNPSTDCPSTSFSRSPAVETAATPSSSGQSSNDPKNPKNPFDVSNAENKTPWPPVSTAPAMNNPWNVSPKLNQQTQPTLVSTSGDMPGNPVSRNPTIESAATLSSTGRSSNDPKNSKTPINVSKGENGTSTAAFSAAPATDNRWTVTNNFNQQPQRTPETPSTDTLSTPARSPTTETAAALHTATTTQAGNYQEPVPLELLYTRRRRSTDETEALKKVRIIEADIMMLTPPAESDLNPLGGGSGQPQDVDLRPYLAQTKPTETLITFPEPKTGPYDIIMAGNSSYRTSGRWKIHKLDGNRGTVYEGLCCSKTFAEAIEEPRFRNYLYRFF